MPVTLMESLLDRRILVSVRYTSGVGGVRVSCHFFNSRRDLDLLLNAAAVRRRCLSVSRTEVKPRLDLGMP